MGENNKKPKGAIDGTTLTKLQEVLPSRYYKEFQLAFRKTYPSKSERVPARQTVYKVINGKSSNTKILNVLVSMAEQQANLKTKLKEALAVC
jgi:hypothetical protein